MNLDEYKVLFMIVTGILTLLVASPALSRLLVPPKTEFFTELWLLGPSHKAEDYPFNITRNENYVVSLGIGNRLGYSAYYLVEVKFRNETQSAPAGFGPLGNRTPSSLPELHHIEAFVADEEVWERPLTFSFDYGFNEALSRVELSSMRLNDAVLDMTGYTIVWDEGSKEFSGFLFFEVWIYDGTSKSFQYHDRFVSLRLNMTVQQQAVNCARYSKELSWCCT